MKITKNFSQLTIKQIRIWTWVAAVAPITGLSAIFLVWLFGTREMFNLVMVIGETTMFTVAVIWWWWVIHIIRKLMDHLTNSGQMLGEIVFEIRDIRDLTKELLSHSDDK